MQPTSFFIANFHWTVIYDGAKNSPENFPKISKSVKFPVKPKRKIFSIPEYDFDIQFFKIPLKIFSFRDLPGYCICIFCPRPNFLSTRFEFYISSSCICILIPVPSPHARFTPSLASPTPFHGPISLLITQNGAETSQNLETSTIQEGNWFEMAVSWLIDWVYLECHGTDKLIAWLVRPIKINSKLWIDWWIEWFGAFCSIDWLIDWLRYSTCALGDTGFALVRLWFLHTRNALSTNVFGSLL